MTDEPPQDLGPREQATEPAGPPDLPSEPPQPGPDDRVALPEPPPLSLEPSPPPLEPPPPPYPFWTYADLLLIAGMTVPCMALGVVFVKSVLWLLRLHPTLAVAELLPAQILGYIFVFVAMLLVFRTEYGMPFWRSLAWFRIRLSLSWIMIAGVATAVAVALAASLLHTPQTSNPMTEMMQDRTSLVLLSIFGVAIAPVAEELAFRGFLQPLLVRSLGAVWGILGAAIPFGILHFHEYGNSWRHAVVISLAGAGFGAMRHFTGSTRAAALMHASYNGFLFLALFNSRKDLPHLW